MKTKRILLILMLLTGIGCGTAQAQILKKLEEGARKASEKLEKATTKVSSALEKVNQTLDTVLDGNVPVGQAASGSYASPSVTKYTVRISVPDDTEIECISEGIVTLKSRGKLAFYSLKGRKMLTRFEWQGTGRYGEATAFSGGACAVKRDGNYYILYPDGTCKDLSGTEVKEIGNFQDGIAAGRKKKGDWGSEPAFFDRNGQPVLKDIVKGLGPYAELKVRKIHEGLRAVQADKWGFVDPSGRIVVEPRYNRVSDFSEGYALVSSGQNKFGVIDRTGAVVLEESISGGYQDPRAFHDGWAYLPGVSGFVNLQGQIREGFSNATDFSEGWMVSTVDYTQVGLIYKDFQTRKILKGHDGSSLHIGPGAPDHLVKGHYLLEDYGDTYLFDKEGRLVLATDSPKCKMQALFDGGYISLVMDKSGNNPYDMAAVAVCGFSGKISVIFDRKGSYTEIGGPENVKEDPEPDPEPEPELEPVPVPQPVPAPKADSRQEESKDRSSRGGGRKTGEEDVEKTEFTIEKLIRVNIGDDLPNDDTDKKPPIIIYINEEEPQPGDTVIIAVEPPENTQIKDVTLREGKKTRRMQNLGPGVYTAVLAAGLTAIDVNFVPGKDPQVKEKWALGGHRNFGQFENNAVDNLEADVRVVMDPSGIAGTPFGEETKGLLIVDFNQQQKFTAYWNDDRNQPIKDFGTYFWGPFRILGLTKEYDGQKYIHMTGGITAIGNWLDRPEGDLGGLLISLLLSMSDFNNDKTGGDPTYIMMTTPHRYRLSYTDLGDGGINLGLLERHSSAYGWVPSNDKRLIEKKTKNMGFMSMSDQSEVPMEPDILQGVELHWIKRPSGLPDFYPGRNWFLDDEQYRHTVEVFDRMYRSQTDKDYGEKWYTREECRQFIKDLVIRWSLKKIDIKL